MNLPFAKTCPSNRSSLLSKRARRSLACAALLPMLSLGAVNGWAQATAAAAAASRPAPTAATTAQPGVQLSAHVREDITRHRAMAAAHDAAARCLESGRSEAQCVKDLQAACKGLAIGKHCGMRHEH
jgi:hypothetical protein